MCANLRLKCVEMFIQGHCLNQYPLKREPKIWIWVLVVYLGVISEIMSEGSVNQQNQTIPVKCSLMPGLML